MRNTMKAKIIEDGRLQLLRKGKWVNCKCKYNMDYSCSTVCSHFGEPFIRKTKKEEEIYSSDLIILCDDYRIAAEEIIDER